MSCTRAKACSRVCLTFAAFPKDPEIHLSDHPVVGKPVTVTCLVPDVYPFDRLEMELLKGKHLLKNKDFLEPMERKSVETKSLEVTFTPTNEDNGKALVCRAKLHIDEIDVGLQERESTTQLQVNGEYLCDGRGPVFKGLWSWRYTAMHVGAKVKTCITPFLFIENMILFSSIAQ